MKANCKFFLWTKLLLCCLAAQLRPNVTLAQTDGWRPLMEIDGIGYHAVDDSGSFVFYPICNQDEWCTEVQKQNYMYLWDFGHGRYSLEATPTVRFTDHLPSEVRLYAKGIKEIKDPDARTAQPLVRPVKDNCTPPDTFVGYSDSLTLTKPVVLEVPRVRILQPSHMPVPGKCTDYLIEWEFASNCKHRGKFEVSGFIGTPTAPLFRIEDFVAGRGLSVTQQDSAHLTVVCDPTEGKRLQLLLHCHVSAEAQVDQALHLQVRGDFVGERQRCKRYTVSEEQSNPVQGSLDPSYFAAGTKGFCKSGDRILWDLRLRNDGNSPETYIEIVDTLPMELDLNAIEFYSATWGGRDIQPVMRIDTPTRRILWILNDDLHPLENGQYAHLQFYAPADYAIPCPDFLKDEPCHRDGLAGHAIIHTVWTKFHGEQVEGMPERVHAFTSGDVKVLCEQACNPRPKPMSTLSLKATKYAAIAIAAGIAFTLFVVVFAFYTRSKAQRPQVL